MWVFPVYFIGGGKFTWCPWQRNLCGISFLLKSNWVSIQVRFTYMHLLWKPYIEPIYANKVLGFCWVSGNRHFSPFLVMDMLKLVYISVVFCVKYKYMPSFWLRLIQPDLSPIKAIPRHFECYLSSSVTQNKAAEIKSYVLVAPMSFVLKT